MTEFLSETKLQGLKCKFRVMGTLKKNLSAPFNFAAGRYFGQIQIHYLCSMDKTIFPAW